MAGNSIRVIYKDDDNVIHVHQENIHLHEDSRRSTIYLYDKGPKGDKGDTPYTPVTVSDQQAQIYQNYTTQSISGLVYSKLDEVRFSSGDSDVNLLSGSSNTVFGSTDLPENFWANTSNYRSKIIYIDIKGMVSFGNNKNLDLYIKIGNNTIPASIGSTGPVDKTTTHPFEINTSLILNNGSVNVCNSFRYCDDNHQYHAYPIGNLFEPFNLSNISGSIGLFISSSSDVTSLTASYAYIEIKN